MKKKLSMVLALISVIGMSQPAWADVWDINFAGGTGSTKVYKGIGIVGNAATDKWGSFNDTSGGTTILSLSGGFGGIAWTAASATIPVDNSLAGSLSSSAVTPMKVTLSDLEDASTVYSVYLFTSSNTDDVTFNGTGVTNLVKDTSYTGTYSGLNVVKYLATTTTAGELNLQGTGTWSMNALQIQAEAVPEPSTVMLLGIGGLIGVIGIKRKYSVA